MIATPGGPFPVTVGAFQTPRPHGGPKVMTVTRIVTLGGPIHVRDEKHEEPKVTTVTRDGSFEASKTMTVTRIGTPGAPDW